MSEIYSVCLVRLLSYSFADATELTYLFNSVYLLCTIQEFAASKLVK